ncbi:M48 family metalloprotease [Micromonospora sp. WMMC415]|uniref:M48 family metalloprotease n=1 Tax=Micromonospora sp. WMMC415 TaxID=2675222 RepID=UPI0012B4C94F|nr:M48 family metalloprotease [Micromonospora sp. WMMC415]QGN48131.1 M48 family metalloprotease [Micromonospora sp. WMMC415]
MTAPSTQRSAPAPLTWLYVLVAALTASFGAMVGDLVFHAYRPLAAGYAVALTGCDRAFPGYPFTGPDHDLATVNAFLGCMREPTQLRGWTMLAGAALLVAGLAVLLVLVPLVDATRLRRHRLALPAAQERFAVLCAEAGLTGRRAPQLMVAGPPVREAFTTARPGGRPLVVLPAAVAAAHADPARFDPVVRHELAHVRARDVAWVSTMRGLPWVVLPAVLAVAALRPRDNWPAVTPALVRSAILVAAIALLAAALLRLREHAADRLVADDGGPDPLAALLAQAPAGTGRAGPRRLLRRALGRHPDPTARIAALSAPAATFDGGFTHALVTAVVTVTAMGAANGVAHALDATRDASGPPAVVAGLLFGLGLTPALFRRATANRGADGAGVWWRPVAGAAAGFVAGAFLLPVTSGIDAVAFPGGTTDPGSALSNAAVTAVAGTSLTVLCVLVARLLADAAPSPDVRDRTWRAVSYLAVGAVVAPAVWAVPVASQAVRSPRGYVHDWFVFFAPTVWWSLSALVPLALAVLLRRRAGRGWWRVPALAAAGATLAAAAVAAVHAARHPARTVAELMAVLQDGQWAAALAGWAVLVALGVRRRRHAVSTAIVAAWTTTAAVGVALHVQSLVAGLPPNLWRFRMHAVAPLVWLLYLTVLTVPALAAVAAVRSRKPRTASRTPPPPPPPAAARSVPAEVSGGGTDPVHAARRWAAPLGASGVALALALLASGPAAALLRAPGTARYAAAAAVTGSPSPTARPPAPPPPRPGHAADPGRLLTKTEAETAARAVKPALPAHWLSKPWSKAPENPITPDTCLPFVRDRFLDPLTPHERVDTTLRYETRPGPVPLASTTLEVGVTSYADRVPATVLTQAEAERAACRRFVTRGEPPITVDVVPGAAPGLGEQSWRVDLRMSAAGSGMTLTGTSAYILIRIGHNLVSVQMTAVMEPLDDNLLRQAVTRTVAALSAPLTAAPAATPARQLPGPSAPSRLPR